tara:strand:+ start:75 stop:458 length:384 start_codon:yes stop_codon:yes gene_type:complete
MKISDYLKNPYVVIGLIGIAFYIYKRQQFLKDSQKEVEPEEVEPEEVETFIDEVEPDEVEPDEEEELKVGNKFITDVEKMDNKVLKRTMETNKQMLKRAKMSSKRKEMIKDMLSYMKKEYDNRTRKK